MYIISLCLRSFHSLYLSIRLNAYRLTIHCWWAKCLVPHPLFEFPQGELLLPTTAMQICLKRAPPIAGWVTENTHECSMKVWMHVRQIKQQKECHPQLFY
jgi:hypothetical protein